MAWKSSEHDFFSFIWELDMIMTEFIEQIPCRKRVSPCGRLEGILPPKEVLANLSLLLKLGLRHWVSTPKKMFWGTSTYLFGIRKWDGKISYLNLLFIEDWTWQCHNSLNRFPYKKQGFLPRWWDQRDPHNKEKLANPLSVSSFYFSTSPYQLISHIVYTPHPPTPLPAGKGGGGWAPLPNVHKGGLDNTLSFRRRLLERGGYLFKGGLQYWHKK